jgi:predicted nucleic acid-binding protein
MGPLKLPTSGAVYVDSNCIIYGVEKVKPYDAMLNPLWQASASGSISVISSQIVLAEVLVKPYRQKNAQLEEQFREFLMNSAEFCTIPIYLHVIERSAKIRAEFGLRTPDAIHAATALDAGAALFVTNDPVFCRVSRLPVAVLSEFIEE